MANDVALLGVVTPFQGQHVAVAGEDNCFPPALDSVFVGDHEVADSNVVPAARQSPSRALSLSLVALFRNGLPGELQRRDAPQVSSGGSSFGPGSRTSVSSNSVMVTTPGAGSSIASTVTVSTVGILGRFIFLALFGAAFFAAARLDVGLAKRFLDFDLAAVRLITLPRRGLPVFRPWLRAVDFLRVVRFFR